MFNTKVVSLHEYEHATDVRIEIDIASTEELFSAELYSLLKAAYEIKPEKTVNAIELFMKEVLEV